MKKTSQKSIQKSTHDETQQKLLKTYMTLLKEFVAFKTVSTDPSYKDEMKKAVNWLTQIFKEHGFKVTLLKGKHANPVVVAKYTLKNTKSKVSLDASEKTVVPSKPKNILVYGHYDVQPAQKSDGWSSDPFVLTKKGDRLVARGVVDNKGQILAHMVGVFDAIKNGALTTHVTFVIEGNEESGNEDLAGLLKKYKKDLAPDFILISDGEIVGEHPTLDMSYRGGGNIKVTYTTSSNDRHSGLYGGAIPNAVLELATLVSKIKSDNASWISFEEFYTGMIEPSDEAKDQHKKISAVQNVQKLAGVKTLTTKANLSAHEQIGLYPTIEVSGFSGGYVGQGFKNIIPGKAEVRLNVRTVHPQKTSDVVKAISNFVRVNTPSHVDVSIEFEDHGEAIRLDTDHADLSGVKTLLADVYSREVICKSIGASIPVVADFQSIFKVPMAMVSLCNDDCNMHGVNENFTEKHIVKALNFTNRYWKGLIQ